MNPVREQLEAFLLKSVSAQAPGTYANAVLMMNNLLHRQGVALSPAVAQSIMANVTQTDAGSMTHSEAAAHEGSMFRAETMNPQLPLDYRLVTAVGAALNTVFSPGYFTFKDIDNYHMQQVLNQTQRELMRRHIAGDLFSS